MLNTLRMKFFHGKQYIPNVRKAAIDGRHRGLPMLFQEKCMSSCSECAKYCPANAINREKLEIDLGKCIFCGDCERACKQQAIKFSAFYKLSTTDRDSLIVKGNMSEADYYKQAITAKEKSKALFGKSLKLRQVSSGGCNGCEFELNACSNPNFDMGRFGIDVVASPRHADGLLITGPLTENMAAALDDAYECIPAPKIIILAGACAISGGLFQNPDALNRSFLEKHPIDLYIPGCPVHPLTVINGILDFVGHK